MSLPLPSYVLDVHSQGPCSRGKAHGHVIGHATYSEFQSGIHLSSNITAGTGHNFLDAFWETRIRVYLKGCAPAREGRPDFHDRVVAKAESHAGRGVAVRTKELLPSEG